MKLAGLWWLPLGRVPEVNVEQLQRWLEQGQSIQLLDARKEMEYQQGTIE